MLTKNDLRDACDGSPSAATGDNLAVVTALPRLIVEATMIACRRGHEGHDMTAHAVDQVWDLLYGSVRRDLRNLRQNVANLQTPDHALQGKVISTLDALLDRLAGEDALG